MSHTAKAVKGIGYEYWGRRSVVAKGCRSPGRYTKTLTHRGERREAQKSVHRELQLQEEER